MGRAWLARIGRSVRRIVVRWSPDESAGGRIGLGRRGERMAVRCLRRSGCRILERNFRAAGAEIDIVAAEADTIVFVEVKARLATATGSPQEAVDARKQRRIRRAAEIYLARHRAHDRPTRFDVVAIVWNETRPVIEHLKGAF